METIGRDRLDMQRVPLTPAHVAALRAVGTDVIEVPRIEMLRPMSETPEMSDIIITVLAARRRRQLDTGDGTLVLIGEHDDRAVRAIAEFASRNRLPYPNMRRRNRVSLRLAMCAPVRSSASPRLWAKGRWSSPKSGSMCGLESPAHARSGGTRDRADKAL